MKHRWLVLLGCLLLAALLLLSSCAEEARQTLGQAYVAPQILNVRSDISMKSGAVTTLKHGELVTIIDVQRRMVKVETHSGSQGWVDSADLLSMEQMKELREERARQRALPSQRGGQGV